MAMSVAEMEALAMVRCKKEALHWWGNGYEE